MDQNLLLTFTSTTQFGIFGAVAFIIFGWLEKKPKFSDLGSYFMIALGVYSLWIILSGQVIVPENTGTEASKEMRSLSFFNGVVICSGIALLSVVLKLFKLWGARLTLVVAVIFAISLFFMVYGIQQS